MTSPIKNIGAFGNITKILRRFNRQKESDKKKISDRKYPTNHVSDSAERRNSTDFSLCCFFTKPLRRLQSALPNGVNGLFARNFRHGNHTGDKCGKGRHGEDKQHLQYAEDQHGDCKIEFGTEEIIDPHHAEEHEQCGDNAVDQCDDHAFIKKDTEYITSPCAYGTQDADFMLLRADAGGNEIHQHQSRKHGEGNADIEENVGKFRNDAVNLRQTYDTLLPSGNATPPSSVSTEKRTIFSIFSRSVGIAPTAVVYNRHAGDRAYRAAPSAKTA